MDADQTPTGMPFDVALQTARELARAVIAHPEVSGVSLFGSLSAGILFLPPPTRVNNVNLVVESRTLWPEFGKNAGHIAGLGIDYQPRRRRFLNARWLLCFPGGGLVKVDPLRQFAEDPDLWVDSPDGREPLIDLFVLPPDWTDPQPYFTKEICTHSFLEVIAPQAVPFTGAAFVPKSSIQNLPAL